MEIAVSMAGFTLSEADTLRKAMGKKDKLLMVSQRAKFVEGCQKNGLTRETGVALFQQCATFARYGWNKAHGIAYSLLSLKTAYMKYHHPGPFYTGMLNAEKDGNRPSPRLIMSPMLLGTDQVPSGLR